MHDDVRGMREPPVVLLAIAQPRRPIHDGHVESTEVRDPEPVHSSRIGAGEDPSYAKGLLDGGSETGTGVPALPNAHEGASDDGAGQLSLSRPLAQELSCFDDASGTKEG